MTTITLKEAAQSSLPELIEHLQPGEALVITCDGQPLAHMTKAVRSSWPCQAGCYRKPDFFMAPDFDAPLDDFKEFME